MPSFLSPTFQAQKRRTISLRSANGVSLFSFAFSMKQIARSGASLADTTGTSPWLQVP
jgi:hypothetical protein